jgi:hypothetical protein
MLSPDADQHVPACRDLHFDGPEGWSDDSIVKGVDLLAVDEHGRVGKP